VVIEDGSPSSYRAHQGPIANKLVSSRVQPDTTAATECLDHARRIARLQCGPDLDVPRGRWQPEIGPVFVVSMCVTVLRARSVIASE
jgi:hypothetical protein